MANNNWAKEAQSLMRSKGIKQKDLIDVFEVNSQGGVSHYFAGRYTPSEEQLERLAAVLDVGKNHFLDLINNQEPELHVDHELLTETFQTIARQLSLSEREITKFFSVYEKMNPAQVAEIYEILMVQKAEKDEKFQSTFRKYGN
ncbi:helix-turn-helix domain-containing protein [Pseudoalteromonas luteoviolacea]|uniref:helix-turn-helix domain-containing protein n=1 Tax=Pseudoalteromonas luteoviolacea TaxID=43657 RepID=UPI001B364197|nr:helix-turn-helix transcriptional regulator [Pseudoalteromonas luteoviolacea]MBQ4836070.1 helix-turn-helix transcriptional regulator [Pseudoalteromonas luteoviolacea]